VEQIVLFWFTVKKQFSLLILFVSLIQSLLNQNNHVFPIPIGCRFTSDVKIKSISVVGGPDGTSPSRMRALVFELQLFFFFHYSCHEIYE
jgi:hypothetical protein